MDELKEFLTGAGSHVKTVYFIGENWYINPILNSEKQMSREDILTDSNEDLNENSEPKKNKRK